MCKLATPRSGSRVRSLYCPELLHLQTRKHIRVNILAAWHVCQKHNGNGRIHGGIPYRKLLTRNAESTEAPLGEDKSKPRCTEQSDFQIVYWPDHVIRHFCCRTQPGKPERRDHWVSHGERDSQHGGHRSCMSARGRPGAIIAPCSGRSLAACGARTCQLEKNTNLGAISCFEPTGARPTWLPTSCRTSTGYVAHSS